MPVLSKEDRAFWEENGYVIVHNAVPQENLDAMVAAIWEFLEMDPECDRGLVQVPALYPRQSVLADISGGDGRDLPAPSPVGQSAVPQGASGFCRDLGRREVVGLAGPGQYETAGARGSGPSGATRG